jgi:hypothetical protein
LRLLILKISALVLLLTPACYAQHYFVTALAGFSTLSADAATGIGVVNSAALYKPENGPAVNLAAGVHLDDWFSLQANWMWNRNDMAVTEFQGPLVFEQQRHSSQDGAIADLLVYFRPRRSRIRPYLSAGTGFVRLKSTASGPAQGTIAPGPPLIDAVKLPIRVAVGVDLMWRRGFGFRYSFSETMTANPFSATLDPAGSRRLANFQNLFGFVKYF